MGYSEFPWANYSEDDMSEFIRLYKQLRDNYAGTLEKIDSVSKRLDKYEAEMDTKIQAKVTDAVTIAMKQYQSELQSIRTDITILQGNIKSLRDYVDTQDAQLENVLRRLIDKEVTEIQNTITMEVSKLNQSIMDTNTKIGDVNAKVERYYAELLEQIATLSVKVDHINEKTYAEMIVRDTAVLKQANDYTDKEVDYLKNLIDAINVELDKESLKWLWDNACNFGGYNAFQWYMDTPITAQEWHDKKFDCVDWYVRGREVFRWFDRRNYMFSPITGKREPVQIVIIELCNLLKHGVTAEEYEKLQLTAEQYTDYNMSGFEYDWKGRDVLDVQ